MKYEVRLYSSGTVFLFECYAGSVDEARKLAKHQYPNASIVSATGVFR